MPQPTFPSLSPSVKCAFRWVRDPALLTVNTPQCKDACAYAINTPMDKLPPFQIYATGASQFGLAQPISWGVYDASGNLLMDLTPDIGLLQVVQFANPAQEYIIYSGQILSQPLPQGDVLYSRITSEAGTYYSEAFTPICSVDLDLGIAPTLVDWGGLVSQFIVNEPPDFDGTDVGERVACTLGSVWTWNGTAWIESAPAEGQWYAISIDGAWYHYVEGEWVYTGVPEDSPIYALDGSLCWTGSVGIALQWEFTDEDEVALVATFAHVSGGAFQLKLNDVVIATFSDGNTSTYTSSIEVEAGDTLVLDPVDASATGCLQLSLKARQNVDQCWKRLTWTNPCNLGSQYYDGGFINFFYLDNRTLVIQPTVEITEEQEEEGSGDEVMTFARKRVTYAIDMGLIPWWVADALSEAALHKTVRLEGDDLLNFATTSTWGETETCHVRTVLNFSLQEDTVQANCCSPWDPPCLTPCYTVRGVFPSASGVGYYVLPNGPTVRYYDGEGFGQGLPCASKLVTGSNGYPDSYFDTDAEMWLPVAELSEDSYMECNAVVMEASVMPRYYGQLQYSINGTDFMDLPGASYSANEWADGVSVTLPEDAISARIRVFVGVSCSMGISPAVDMSCICPFVTISGAGSADANGVYTRVLEGQYLKDGDSQWRLSFIPGEGGYWIISFNSLNYYVNYTGSDNILVEIEDLTTPWVITFGAEGENPVPTVLCS